jgi:hypothetical protein
MEEAMKTYSKTAVCLLFVGLALFFASCGGESGNKQSAADAVAAYKQARKDGKPIMLDFYSPG